MIVWLVIWIAVLMELSCNFLSEAARFSWLLHRVHNVMHPNKVLCLWRKEMGSMFILVSLHLCSFHSMLINYYGNLARHQFIFIS